MQKLNRYRLQILKEQLNQPVEKPLACPVKGCTNKRLLDEALQSGSLAIKCRKCGNLIRIVATKKEVN